MWLARGKVGRGNEWVKREGGMFPTRVSAQWRLIYDAQALMHALILASADGQATGAAEFLSFAVR